MSHRRPLSFHRFDITGGGDDSTVYLRRWSLQLWRGWSIKVHLFFRPDGDSCLHDHPWRFWTLVLWGGYVERVETGEEVSCRPLTLHYRPAEYRQTILRLRRRNALTLVLSGPRERRWGFWTSDGWRHWKEFLARPQRAHWCREDAGVEQREGGV